MNGSWALAGERLPSILLEMSKFPRLMLRPPYPPMEARQVEALPEAGEWQYEPKWDGFRCLAFWDGIDAALQSKSGQPLARYFPEVVAAVRELPPGCVLDGELATRSRSGPDFDALLQRIHPAASRIERLARETPAAYHVFDLLAENGTVLTDQPLADRRRRLEMFARRLPSPAIALSPATRSLATARTWLSTGDRRGLDGVVAKRLDAPYDSGGRTAMLKIKRIRTADCVVGGFRWARKGGAVGSLLLGLYDDRGRLDHVGFCSGFTRAARQALHAQLKPLEGGRGFTGDAPGGPSRWSSAERSSEWVPLTPKLVCEVEFDHFTGGRFRHGVKFLRWRPDKAPRQCTFEQVA